MNNHSLRIIGGQFRGRRITFPDAKGLRPTPDPVRETAFNWLMHKVHGATCLDAFAGSGAMGIEALSRGAERVIFLEQQAKVVNHLKSVVNKLEISSEATIRHESALKWLKNPTMMQFDLVFLDPPFKMKLLRPTLDALLEYDWLHNDGQVYVEYDNHFDVETLADDWNILKSKNSGMVGFALLGLR